MQIDDFVALAKSRQSCRNFKPDPVPDEYIEKILEATRWSMSGANGQPWEFVVVKDKATKSQLNDAMNVQGEMVAWLETSRVPEMRQPRYLNIPKPAPYLWRIDIAPVIIVPCGDSRTAQASVLARCYDSRSVVFENMTMAEQSLHLAVAACGLRSRFLTVTFINEDRVKAILGIPPVFRVFSLVPIGYPAQKLRRSYRRELKEIVHYEKYDMSKYRSHEQVQEFIKSLRQSSRPVYAGEKKIERTTS